ncbi:MAG TPA: cytochrome c oxidase subunit II transmembrane domain-containing protein, partial [Candidatus Polarisedimenticolaceae bacterium]|nr:cytochrome c oxidase subunit II transmembrane domain-containing protein [Candidatus Polarisedimenticolaceae bacterium]
MNRNYKLLLLFLPVLGLILAAVILLGGSNVAVLNPKGLIASEQRQLITVATLLMLIVVIPVFVMTFGIAWKYRAGNKRATYSPEWDHNRVAETLWWGIPSVIILILAV